MSIYKWLYTHLTPFWKRPWTFVRRDFYHIAPILNLFIFFWTGFWLGFFYPGLWAWVFSKWWHLLIVVGGVWLAGGLQFHFFWGTKYIPNQQGE